MSKKTACPLDCYDGCEIEFVDGRIKPSKGGLTQGFLCSKLNHFQDEQIITQPRYRGQNITMEEALNKLCDMLRTSEDVLHYRGHGNFALMQEVSDHFFSAFGATLTDGSLCDGAGEAGILAGRGSNKNLSMHDITNSEVVIFWGRNPHTTSSHLLPLIKDKKIIVIDPIKTKIAKMADLHIQIKPHGDLKLAMLLTRFAHIENLCDEEYLDRFASEFEDYYELTQTIRIKAAMEEIGVNLGNIGDMLSMVAGKKVAIVCGVGIQKYKDGGDVMRAIDAFGVALGLFAKDGSGISYLGDSKAKITSPFITNAKRVSKVDTKFCEFDTVFIQGANPLSQMPNSLRVEKSLKSVKHLVYFGLYENETSELAELIIPAKEFLYKNDIRVSYAHNEMRFMDKVASCDNGISEYDLTRFLSDKFCVELEDEEFYLQHFKSFRDRKIESTPYKDGFDTEDGEFRFLEEYDNDFNMQDKLFLITSKNISSLNSQFRRDKFVYLHPNLGFADGVRVVVVSEVGEVELEVRVNQDLREDCVLIYSGVKGVNNLTTSKRSYEGNSAIYQALKVEVKSV